MSVQRVVAERYELVRPVGRGTAGAVYVARERPSGRLVALKLIPARAALDERAVARFAGEARAASAALEHPGIVSILEAGHDVRAASLFVAMELLHGETLRDVLASGSRERRLDLLEAALEPLSFAHARGLVHRDLEPANVFASRRRTGEEIVMLIDFGLARLVLESGLAAPDVAVGAPAYMAPEQLDGSGRVGPATDVWAFGVMLYEALAGRRPFDDAAPEVRAERIRTEPHAPLDAVMDEPDPGLSRLVDLCLLKDPAARPQDARTLLRLVKTLRGGFAGLLHESDPKGVMMNTVIDTTGSAPNPPPPELESALRRSPRDPEIHRALLAFYRDAGVKDGVWLAAAALELVGAATRDEIRLHRHFRRPPAIGHDRGLDAGSWAALLHHDQDPRIDAVWSEIAGALLALHRRGDEELGLDAARKLDLGRPSEELARAFALALGVLRPGTMPRLYRGTASGGSPRHLQGHPPASIFPRGFEEPLPAGALPFAVGRHVAYYRSSHRVCTVLHEPEALESVFDAALRIGLRWPAQREEQARMSELLAERLTESARVALRTVCARLGTSAGRVDLGTWRRAVELSCCRAGVLLGADLGSAAWMLRWLQERRRIPADDAIDDILTFWSSGAHVRLRHQIGLSLR